MKAKVITINAAGKAEDELKKAISEAVADAIFEDAADVLPSNDKEMEVAKHVHEIWEAEKGEILTALMSSELKEGKPDPVELMEMVFYVGYVRALEEPKCD